MSADIERIEKVLASLIVWMAQSANSPISARNAETLLKMLSAEEEERAHRVDG